MNRNRSAAVPRCATMSVANTQMQHSDNDDGRCGVTADSNLRTPSKLLMDASSKMTTSTDVASATKNSNDYDSSPGSSCCSNNSDRGGDCVMKLCDNWMETVLMNWIDTTKFVTTTTKGNSLTPSDDGLTTTVLVTKEGDSRPASKLAAVESDASSFWKSSSSSRKSSNTQSMTGLSLLRHQYLHEGVSKKDDGTTTTATTPTTSVSTPESKESPRPDLRDVVLFPSYITTTNSASTTSTSLSSLARSVPTQNPASDSSRASERKKKSRSTKSSSSYPKPNVETRRAMNKLLSFRVSTASTATNTRHAESIRYVPLGSTHGRQRGDGDISTVRKSQQVESSVVTNGTMKQKSRPLLRRKTWKKEPLVCVDDYMSSSSTDLLPPTSHGHKPKDVGIDTATEGNENLPMAICFSTMSGPVDLDIDILDDASSSASSTISGLYHEEVCS